MGRSLTLFAFGIALAAQQPEPSSLAPDTVYETVCEDQATTESDKPSPAAEGNVAPVDDSCAAPTQTGEAAGGSGEVTQPLADAPVSSAPSRRLPKPERPVIARPLASRPSSSPEARERLQTARRLHREHVKLTRATWREPPGLPSRDSLRDRNSSIARKPASLETTPAEERSEDTASAPSSLPDTSPSPDRSTRQEQ